MLGAINADADHPIATQLKLARVRHTTKQTTEHRIMLTSD